MRRIDQDFRRSTLYLLWLVLGMVFIFLMVLPGKAQEPTPSDISDDQVNAIAKQMYCPVCESTPLDVCPTQACAQWRELIREKLAAGWGEKQIKEYFVEQYGARVLAAPPARGFYWLIYLVPPVVILVGLFVLFRALRTWNRSASATATPMVESSQDEYIQRMEEELSKQK